MRAGVCIYLHVCVCVRVCVRVCVCVRGCAHMSAGVLTGIYSCGCVRVPTKEMCVYIGVIVKIEVAEGQDLVEQSECVGVWLCV